MDNSENTSPQRGLGTPVDKRREQVASTIYLCFHWATPFCNRVSIHEDWWKVPSEISNSENAANVYFHLNWNKNIL